MLDPTTSPLPAPLTADSTPAAAEPEPAEPGASSPQPAAAPAEPAFDREDPRYALARQWAEGAGMPLEQLDGLAARFADYERREFAAAVQAERFAIQELAREWGVSLEPNYNAVCDWIDATARTVGERQALEAMTGSAAGCRLALRLAKEGSRAMTTNAGTGTRSAGLTEADKKDRVQELMRDPRYWDSTDRAYKNHVQREMARLYPGQTATAVDKPSFER
jgi:hypothetical protein